MFYIQIHGCTQRQICMCLMYQLVLLLLHHLEQISFSMKCPFGISWHSCSKNKEILLKYHNISIPKETTSTVLQFTLKVKYTDLNPTCLIRYFLLFVVVYNKGPIKVIDQQENFSFSVAQFETISIS